MNPRLTHILKRIPLLRKTFHLYLLVKERHYKRLHLKFINHANRFNSINYNFSKEVTFVENLKIILDLKNFYEWRIYNSFLGRKDLEAETFSVLFDTLHEGDIFIDVGANLGIFTLLASRRVGHSGKVICFEPSLMTYRRLVQNVRLNSLKNIIPYRLGISSKFEIKKLYKIKGSHDLSSMYKMGEEFEIVQNVNLDAIPVPKPVKLIKIDCEGCELNALLGAQKLISNSPSMRVVMEFNPDYSGKELFNYLRTNFNIYGLEKVRSTHIKYSRINDVLGVNSANIMCERKDTTRTIIDPSS